MIQRIASRILLYLLVGSSLVLSSQAESLAPTSHVESAARAELLDKSTNNVFHPLSPGPIDGKIAWVMAQMLPQLHYSRQRFDAKVSSKFLDRYLDTLDSQHMHFTQADLAEFEPYRTNLDRLTLGPRGMADTRPGCEIFNRFMLRFQQHVAYVDEMLKTENFTFDSDERVIVNRHEMPYPKDLDAAKRIWGDRLRLEYLQEKLGKDEAKKTAKKEHADTQGKAKTDAAAPAVKPKSEREEIVETLTRRYHRTLRTFNDWNSDDVLQYYLNALAHVYDPHTDYLGKQQLDSFSISMNLSLFGIGAELTSSEDGYCTIRRLLPGGPAMKSKKIQEKDRIVAVAQGGQTPVDVVDMNLTKAVQLIRGPKGTEVRLTIIPAGADASTRKVVSLIRDEIPLEDQAAKAKVIDVADSHGQATRLGVIDLPSFYAPFDLGAGRKPEIAKANTEGSTKSTSADVARLLNKLKQENVKGIVLDLRRNGGGSLEEAIKLTGLFIKDGPVVQVRSTNGKIERDDDNDPSILWDGPLIVLTSRLSASASEILAGALQDYARAIIVGDSSTHGKGTVQSVNPLRPYMQLPDDVLTSDPGALKVTIKKFYRPSGVSTQLKGVVPDMVLPSVWSESKDLGESALDNPLQCDTIASAQYDTLNMVTNYLPELKRHSDQRLATDKEFSYIREDIGLFRKQQADKTVSLNEKVRLKEREEQDTRQKARDKERLARKDTPDKVYELTLKDVNVPGLPAPEKKTNSIAAKASTSAPATDKAAIANGTNTLASASPTNTAPDADDDAEEEKPPAVDAALVETEHILVDYLSLLDKGHLVTASPSPASPIH
jgi:carboxyl-terminal processing protease